MNYPRGIVTDMPVDPMLVVRRHVDLQRVRSAICIDAR
ncbi:putative leader peptide [Herbidospora sp. RD11066]